MELTQVSSSIYTILFAHMCRMTLKVLKMFCYIERNRKYYIEVKFCFCIIVFSVHFINLPAVSSQIYAHFVNIKGFMQCADFFF